MVAKELLTQLIQAVESRQPERISELLSESDFEYIGPNTRITDITALTEYLLGMSAILKRITLRQLIAEPNQACATLDFETHFEPIGDVRVALIATLKGERIGRLEAFYNAAVVENMLRVDEA